ncbi:MAG: efflux RND transporter periplasmic adaptor subunit [Alcanivorax sp.]|nr:efflux RND transporter periplasmic adaptor subunit [Alcanivorax sp.]
MKKLLIVAILSLLGLAATVGAVWHDSLPCSSQSHSLAPFTPPFHDYVAGTGLLEPATRQIPVGVTIPGVVARVFVKPGERVDQGAPLFQIDDRQARDVLAVAQARVLTLRAQYQRAQHHLATRQRLENSDSAALSHEEMIDLQDAVAEKQAALQLAKTEVSRQEHNLALLTVRARLAAQVLSVDVQPGQYVEASSTAPPAVVLGGGDNWNLRIDVDEQDAWRVKPQASAVAYLRGHPELRVQLQYRYTEPYVTTRKALSGLPTERSDSRVLQVVYAVTHAGFPLYVGQQLDAFIEASQ